MHINGPFYEVAGRQQELGAGMTGQVSIAYMWDSEAKTLHKVRRPPELVHCSPTIPAGTLEIAQGLACAQGAPA